MPSLDFKMSFSKNIAIALITAVDFKVGGMINKVLA